MAGSGTLDLATLPDVSAELDPDGLSLLTEHILEEIRRAKRDPLNHGLPPHAGQERVHYSAARHVLLIAANRWGKTYCMMREVLWRATGTHPYKRLRRHRMIWVGFPDFGFYNKVTLPMFHALCPKGALLDFNETKKQATIRHADGGTCEIFFMSYEMGREKWQGGAVDFIALDEEHPEEIYKEATARLIDTRGHMLQTLTPVSGMGWIYDRIYLPGKSGQRKIEIVEGALAEYDESQPYGVGRVLVPHLEVEDVIRFAEEVPDEDERAIRIFGKFRARSGGVYKQFDEAVHVIAAFAVPKHWRVWGAIDPGYHGFATTFFAQSPHGRVYVVAEYFSQAESTDERFQALTELYREIRGAEEGETLPPCVMFGDTEDPQVILELNLKAQEVAAPLAFTQLDQGLKAVKAGIQRVQQQLLPKANTVTPEEVTRPTPEAGEPMLYFFSNLWSRFRINEELTEGSRLLWEITRYLWKKPKRGSTLKVDEPDKESAAGAHMLDTLRYGLMARLGPPEELIERRPKTMDEEVWEHMREIEREALGDEEWAEYSTMEA